MTTDETRGQAVNAQSLSAFATKMRTYTFKRWSGGTTTVQAEAVTFADGGVIAFTIRDRLVLAVCKPDWQDLKEIDPDAAGDRQPVPYAAEGITYSTDPHDPAGTRLCGDRLFY
jgi:hypothetical protein